jgi:hypothetical protein
VLAHGAQIIPTTDIVPLLPASTPLTAKAVRLLRFARVAQRVRGARMLVMQEDGKLRSYGFALRRHCLIEEMILHLLGQVAPYPNNSLA